MSTQTQPNPRTVALSPAEPRRFPGWRGVAVAFAFPIANRALGRAAGWIAASAAGSILFMLLSGLLLARFTAASSHVTSASAPSLRRRS